MKHEGSSEVLLVSGPKDVCVSGFKGSTVHIRGGLHTSGSAIMMSVAQTTDVFAESTVLVCEVSGKDAILFRKLQAVLIDTGMLHLFDFVLLFLEAYHW